VILKNLRRSLAGFAIVLTFIATGCQQRAADKPKAPFAKAPMTDDRRAQHLASFDKVWTTIKDLHWDPNLNGVDWEAARAELRPKVESAKTDAQARAAMTALINKLKQSHFGIIPSEVYAKLDALPSREKEEKDAATKPSEKGPGESGVRVRVVDDKAIVTRVDADSAGAAAGIEPGWELLRVEKFNVNKVLKDVRAAHKGQSLLPAFEALAVTGLLEGDAGEQLDAQFRDGRGKKVTKSLSLRPPAGNAFKFMNMPTFHIQTESREAAPKIAYFWFTAWMDPANVMDEFRHTIDQYKDADGFILDLRANPGGIGFMANGMAGYLVDQPNLRLGEMNMRTGTIKFVVNPQPVTFNGPVAILIDECSMSTSEIMAGGMKDIGRARVFGTPSPGAALPSRIEKLPNGDGFQYAFANYVSAKGDVLEGKGVVPDEIVKPDRKSLLAGKDPVIEAAVKWIRSQKNNNQDKTALSN
jgi:carboxyl-terminal processing protease